MSTIVILAFGTRGDVAPVTGLGTTLSAAGHTVAVAAQEPYRNMITGAGLEFRSLPKDTETETRNSPSAQNLINGGRMKPSRSALAEMVEQLRGVGPAMAQASRDADLLIAASPVSSMFGYHIAAAMGIPSMAAFLQPLAPTGDFAPPPLGTRWFGRWGNRAMWRIGALGEKAYLPLINELRNQLGLALTNLSFQKKRDTTWPVIHGYSEIVVPQPTDWHEHIHTTGYWWPPTPADWQPSDELAAFLDDGPPPVYVGLGSTATVHGEHLSALIGEAVRESGVRAVVQSGWARLHCDGPGILTIADAPHEWLFPRCAAVVHHCGAGTTGAGLRAGVPAVAIPGIMDQPFWAKRLHDLGVAPAPLKRSALSARGLATAITEATTQESYRNRATDIAARLAKENGQARAVEIITSVLTDVEPAGTSK